MNTTIEFLTFLTRCCEERLAIPSEDIVDGLSDAIWLSGRLAMDFRAWELSPTQVSELDDPIQSEDSPDVPTNSDSDASVDVTSSNDTDAMLSRLPSTENDLFAESVYGTRSIVGTKLSFPCVSPLRGPLEFERAFRPFASRIRNNRNQVLDETATADRIAATFGSVWSVSTKPALERPWEGLMVVERSPTMRFWHDTVDSFQKLMWRTSAFQRLSTAYLDSFGSTAVLHANQSLSRPCSIEELSSETDNEWIFFFTDFRSTPWLNGSMIETLRNWKRISKVLIVHMMPQSYWEHSALRQCERIQLGRHEASNMTSNAGFDIVPLVSFEANSFADWASWVSGKSTSSTSGIRLKSRSTALVQSNTKPATFTAQQDTERATYLFRRFQSFATEPAQTLARSLAAAPLILPVIRLIQRQLVPKSTNSHLAEVLYSGLVKRVSPAETTTDSNTIEYDFLPGIRDELLDQSSRQRIHDVWNVNWEYMKSNYGHGIDFNAILANPSSADKFSVASANDISTAFVRVCGRILQRYGGEQARAGTKLLNTINDQPAKLAASPEAERKSRDYETLKIEFEDGTNLPKGAKFSWPLSKTANTYQPSAAKSSRSWRTLLRNAGYEFLDLLERGLIVTCSLHQSITPSPARRESRNLWRTRLDTVDATVDGLGFDFEKLSNTGEELVSDEAFVDENGVKICDVRGKYHACKLGMKRVFYLSGQGSPNSRERIDTVNEFREIAKNASQALTLMSRVEAKKLWRNWKHGFPASCFGKDHL